MPRTQTTPSPAPTFAKPKRKKVEEGRSASLRATASRSLSNVPIAEITEDFFDLDKPLTEKQRAFAKHWASGMSVNGATVAAGFSANSVTMTYKLTRHPHILALYNEERRKCEEAANVTRQDVMDMLKESFEMAKMLAEPSTMVSAAREIGKMCGYYEPIKVQISHGGTVAEQRKQMEAMSDEELLKMVAEGGHQAVQQRVDEMKEANDAEDVTDVQPKPKTKRLQAPKQP